MNVSVSTFLRGLQFWGLQPRSTVSAITGLPRIRRDRKDYEKQRTASKVPEEFPIRGKMPIVGDWKMEAGEASGHYFHQDLLVAREIHRRSPDRHIDVGSSIYGFVSHVASFRKIDVIDVRPVLHSVEGIRFIQADITSLPSDFDEAADSVSCLHALEHMGLGRYGDPVDYEGWRMGLQNLARMVRSSGVLYLAVPIGITQRVEFNAHRVFSVPFMSQELDQLFDIEDFSYVDDFGVLHEHVDLSTEAADNSFGLDYGCGIWTVLRP